MGGAEVRDSIFFSRLLLIHSTLSVNKEMTTIAINRAIGLSVTGLSVVLIALTILTYSHDQEKSNWVCGPVLFLVEIISIGIQSIITIIIWRIENRKQKIGLLGLSILIVGFITYGFVNFNLNCT